MSLIFSSVKPQSSLDFERGLRIWGHLPLAPQETAIFVPTSWPATPHALNSRVEKLGSAFHEEFCLGADSRHRS